MNKIQTNDKNPKSPIPILLFIYITTSSFHTILSLVPKANSSSLFCEWEMIHPAQGKEEDEKEEEDADKEEDEPRCEWDFHLSTVVSSSVAGGGAISDTLGVIEFDPSDQLLATGGIARKIRIYSLKSLLPHESGQGLHPTTLLDHNHACDYYICTPAKLSSLRWCPDFNSRVVGSGDYDGVITEYDLERRVAVFERDEHGGRRAWSVDYSRQSPTLGASGSDDGSAHVWDRRCAGGACVAVVSPSTPAGAPICCVEFDPFGGALIALGSADRVAYTYDIRKTTVPVSTFCGHGKTVTYVRFVKEDCLLTASIDGRLKLWNTHGGGIIRTYKGHVNSRSFVGLSVWRNGGLFGCGSENNEVFVYDKRWGQPIWVRGLEPMDDQRFVSSVCWRQAGEEECTLVAGGSDGVLQVFMGTKKPSPLS